MSGRNGDGQSKDLTNGANGIARAKRTRDAGLDAGLIVARSKQSYISEIFMLPRDQWEAKLVEYARREHDEAAGRAREQIRRILESE